MAVYKVPQDVEADDKLVGPFSFKQFIFILLFIGLMWLAWLMARISPLLAIIPLPFALIFLILGMPLRKDQPTDVYVAALINFWMRPKVRLWGQEGMLEHVTITAPKKVDEYISDGLSSGQVKSRLDSLAKTMDTRGWSSKNANLPGAGFGVPGSSDRLVAPTLTANRPIIEAEPVVDMLDTENSAVAQNIARIEAEKASHDISASPQAAIKKIQPPQQSNAPGSVVMPGQTPMPEVEPVDDGGLKVADEFDTLAAPEYNPYPSSIQQHVINPINDPRTTSNSDDATDIINGNDKSDQPTNPTDVDLSQGGEVDLR